MDALPDELLDLIVSEAGYFPYDRYMNDASTLLNIAFVCKRLYNIALPYLYQSIAINVTASISGSQGGQKSIRRSAAMLPKTLQTRKYIAKHVKRLRAHNRTGIFEAHGEQCNVQDATMYELFDCLPNLEELDARKYYSFAAVPFLLSSEFPVATKAHLFSKLQSLSLDIQRVLLIDLLPLFRLPKLTELSLHRGQLKKSAASQSFLHTEADWDQAIASSPNTVLKHLSFSKLCISRYGGELQRIPALCKSLASFKMQDYLTTEREGPLIEDEFIAYLKHVLASTLTRLHLYNSDQNRFPRTQSSLVTAMSSLSQSTSVQHLHIDPIFLINEYPIHAIWSATFDLGASCPPYIQRLALRAMGTYLFYASAIIAGLRQFCSFVQQGRFPRLQRVTLELSRDQPVAVEHHYDEEAELEYFRKVLGDAGVVFKVSRL